MQALRFVCAGMTASTIGLNVICNVGDHTYSELPFGNVDVWSCSWFNLPGLLTFSEHPVSDDQGR